MSTHGMSPENRFLVPDSVNTVLEVGAGVWGMTALDSRAGLKIGEYTMVDCDRSFPQKGDDLFVRRWR